MNERRRFLKSLVAVPVLAAGCATTPGRNSAVAPAQPLDEVRPISGAKPATTVRPEVISGDRPRHVIHLVADGMSSGILTAADHHSQFTRGRGLSWFDLVRSRLVQPGFMNVRSQNSLVTDSSASSSAWGSGVRIPNGKVNQSSTGGKLATLYELLGSSGWKRGLVTTTEITHATPAGFIACEEKRENGEAIAAQYLERRIEVALGGGSNHFSKDKRKDKRDLAADFAVAGYAVLRTPTDLENAPMDRPLLGIFCGGHLPYLVDQRGDLTKPAATPSLANLTRTALRRLSIHERFILQVEGGRVDHGGHSNDAASAILEMIGFDEALDVCLEFQREHPDTLLVITTDHATANPGLNGLGDNYGKSTSLFHHVSRMRQSTGEIVKRLQLSENVTQLRARLRESTGFQATLLQIELLRPFLRKRGHALFEGLNSEVGALGQVLANYLGISFTSTNHTADYVPILALGPGAERFRGFVENTEVFEHYLDFAGVQFRNPQERLVVDASGAVPTENTEEYWRV